MENRTSYQTPFGEVILTAEGSMLTGLWFTEQGRQSLGSKKQEQKSPILEETKRWLDIYFTGKEPNFMPKIKIPGSIFQIEVWEILRQIPYGETMTYGEIAKMVARKRGVERMSAQAVGHAVGKNKIAIIIPCHRVIGSDGRIVGYAGGVERKIQLLALEKRYLQQNVLQYNICIDH